MSTRLGIRILAIATVAILAAPAFAANEPVFSLAWSEYPSWSVFGVCDELGIIDGDVGKLGLVEKKWGIDINRKEAEDQLAESITRKATTDAEFANKSRDQQRARQLLAMAK